MIAPGDSCFKIKCVTKHPLHCIKCVIVKLNVLMCQKIETKMHLFWHVLANSKRKISEVKKKLGNKRELKQATFLSSSGHLTPYAQLINTTGVFQIMENE